MDSTSVCSLYVSLKRTWSPEFKRINQLDEYMSLPSNNTIRRWHNTFLEEYSVLDKKCIADPGQTRQRSIVSEKRSWQTQQLQSFLRLDHKKLPDKPFTRYYTPHYHFGHIKLRCWIFFGKLWEKRKSFTVSMLTWINNDQIWNKII